MKKYSWFENHEEELSFTVVHTENDEETIIAATDTAEKADFITKACNQFNLELHEADEDLQMCESCEKKFDFEIMQSDSADCYFCPDCWRELAPIMKAEYEQLKANGELDE